MDAPFIQGVPYFSRVEEARARSIARSRLDKNSVPTIIIKAGDVESFELVKRVRLEVAAWRNLSTVRITQCLRSTKSKLT